MNRPPRNTLLVALLACALTAAGGCQSNTSLRQDGIVRYNQGDYAAAADLFQRAIDKADNDYQSHYWLGVTQLKLERPVPAQVNLERAPVVRYRDPAFEADVLDALAEAYYRQGRTDDLAAFLASTASQRRGSADYLRQGKYLARIGDVDAARAALQKGVEFAAPGDAAAHMAVADFYRDLGDGTNELVALKYAYHVNPKHPGLTDRLRALGTVPGPTVAVEPPRLQVLE